MEYGRTEIGDYLANIQTSVFTVSYQHVGTKWTYSNKNYEYNLLYYITEGSCRIRIGDEEIRPSAGQMVLLPEGTNLSTSSNDESLAKYYCHFTASLGEIRLFDVLRLSPLIEARDRPAIEESFRQLIQYSKEKNVTSALRGKSVLLQLLCYFIENSPIREVVGSGHSALDAVNVVLRYIESHLSEKLSVEKLARLVHFHPHYFIHVFKTMIGCPPMQYITKLRLEQARVFLASTGIGVQEVAERVGIEADYFAKFFKHHAGMSPTEYRNRKGGKPTAII